MSRHRQMGAWHFTEAAPAGQVAGALGRSQVSPDPEFSSNPVNRMHLHTRGTPNAWKFHQNEGKCCQIFLPTNLMRLPREPEHPQDTPS